MAITDKKISTIYAGRDISSLSDRPNQDGMTATELKARFDQLGKEIIPKINDLIDELFADLYSGATQTGHTHNLDNLVDGITYKLFTAVERAKLALIEENAEVNQNAFSNVKVGSTTIASNDKTDTFELVAGLNITMTVDALMKKVFFSATGDLATEAVQSLIVDIGNYYDALNVEDALQEIGYVLANLSGSAEDIAITDVGEYFTSENVEGALQEVGAKLSPSDSKTTPVDADTLLVSDSADLNIFKKLSWANIKATLKAYFDTLYAVVDHVHSIYAKKPTNEATATSNQILTANGDGTSTYKNLLMPKNWIINGMFDVWQRSTSQTTSGYGSDDRFNNINFGSTKTHSQQAFTVGQTAVPNNPKYFSRTVVSSVAGVGNYASKAQRIEDVVKLAGKTITFSFWAKADANKNMAIEFVQNFGSGGSASVVGIGVQKFALTSSWQKFTKTITLPSVSGKTIGIDNYLALSFWFDAGSDFNARTDSLGNQSGTFDIANVSIV